MPSSLSVRVEVSREDFPETARGTLVLALPDSAYARQAERRLRQEGWDVCRAESCDELRRLAWSRSATAVVLPVEPGDETGWLTCAKLLRTQPGLRVVLVAESAGRGRAERFRAFVGAAALVRTGDGVEALVGRLDG